jgi:hypothetical protein
MWDFCTYQCDFHTQIVILTGTSAIYTCRVWFPRTECDLYTQSVISTHHDCDFDTHECGFLHAECDLCTHECNLNTNKCDFFMQSMTFRRRVWFIHAEFGFNIHKYNFLLAWVVFILVECDFYSQSAIWTCTNVISTHLSFFFTRRVWFPLTERDFHMQRVILIRKSVILSRSRVFFIRIVWLSYAECDFCTHECDFKNYRIYRIFKKISYYFLARS